MGDSAGLQSGWSEGRGIQVKRSYILHAKFQGLSQRDDMSAGQINLQMPDFSQAQHIGDTENHKILHYEHNGTNIYGITVNDQPKGYLQTIPKGEYEEVNQIYVEPQFRGQHLAHKLFFFLKSYLGKSFLMGNVQSKDGQAFIQSIAKTGRFTMFWLNTKTGEKHPYDVTQDQFNLDPYRSLAEPTDWQILVERLENKERLAKAIPQFLEETDWQRGICLFDGEEDADDLF